MFFKRNRLHRTINTLSYDLQMKPKAKAVSGTSLPRRNTHYIITSLKPSITSLDAPLSTWAPYYEPAVNDTCMREPSAAAAMSAPRSFMYLYTRVTKRSMTIIHDNSGFHAILCESVERGHDRPRGQRHCSRSQCLPPRRPRDGQPLEPRGPRAPFARRPARASSLGECESKGAIAFNKKHYGDYGNPQELTTINAIASKQYGNSLCTSKMTKIRQQDSWWW